MFATTDGGSPSAPSLASNSVTTPTAAITNLSANEVSTTEIDLTWTVADSDATGIQILGSTDGGVTFTAMPDSPLSAAATSDNYTGLTEGTNYVFEVSAVKSDGSTTAPTAVSAYTLPAAPSNLQADAISPTEVDLTWTDNSGFVPLDPHIEAIGPRWRRLWYHRRDGSRSDILPGHDRE